METFEEKQYVNSIDKYFYSEFSSTDNSFRKSVDFDAFFGYDKRKQHLDKHEEHHDFTPNRVLLNNVDVYNGQHIARFLQSKTFGVIGGPSVDEEAEEEEEAGGEEEEEGGGDEDKKAEKAAKEESENKSKDKIFKADAEKFYEEFIEYEYIDALYAKYDVSKLTVFEYGELLSLKTHEERLLYLERKFGVLKKEFMVNESTSTEVLQDKKIKNRNRVRGRYELVGCVKQKKMLDNHQIFDDVIYYDPRDFHNYVKKLVKCGVFVFDITLDHTEIQQARFVLNNILETLAHLQEKAPKDFSTMDISISFILISPLLTWAATKPIDPDDPGLPFNEKDFKKRRAHPMYTEHLQLEKDLFAAAIKYKNKLKAYVIGVGGVYGYEEHILHYLFKSAWLNEKELSVFGKGRNRVPLIHIDDLAMILHIIISNPPKTKYIFAVEKPVSSLKTISKAVSKALGSGKITKVPKEHAFLIPEITQPFYDYVTSNLNVESNVLDEELNMKWRSDKGFVEIIQNIGKEFKASRKLSAIKILVVGPPGSGKTRICMNLSEYYNINYLTLHIATDTYIRDLKDKIRETEKRIADKGKEGEEEEEKTKTLEEGVEGEEKAPEEEEGVEEDEEEEEEDDEQMLETLKEDLKTIQQNLEDGEGNLNNEFSVKVMKDRLLSTSCQNQGYVLDGFPTTLEQTNSLFGLGEGEDEEEGGGEEKVEEDGEEGAQVTKSNKKTIPDIVICLEACNDVLYRNLLKHPDIAKNNISEEEIFKCIQKYRKMNTDDNTLLIFFDALERYPHVLNIENDKTPNLDNVFEKILSLVGTTSNYDSAKLAERERIKKSEAIKNYQELINKKRKEVKKLRKEAIRKKLEMWAAEVDRMKEEEEEILASESVPLRHYLIKFIFPTLTNGLIEVARIKPDDPIDYLAEYLFKENPEGRMFVGNKEEPIEIKKMINMLYDFKNYLHETTHIDSDSFFGDKSEIPPQEAIKKLKETVRESIAMNSSEECNRDSSLRINILAKVGSVLSDL